MPTPRRKQLPRAASIDEEVQGTLARLEKHRSARVRDGMARYGLPNDLALGVSMSDIQKIGKEVGRNHALALALWETGVYEARLLTAFIDEPARVTGAQMDRWCRDFDNWGVVDTLCFKLWDQVPQAWSKVTAWSGKRDEFGKRAAFVLLACLAAHDKTAADARFLAGLDLIERAATDDRNFVKKGVSWALRMIGRRNVRLNAAASILARRLADSPDQTVRWLGRNALREITNPQVAGKLKP